MLYMNEEYAPITTHLQTFIPMDRRLALQNDTELPDRTNGAALFADISGFTPLTRTLLRELGPRRGAEEILHQINPVYDALIAKLHRYGGSVIVFAGDSITCWLDGDDGCRAVTCALEMQVVMERFATVHSPAGTPISMAVKLAVAVGSARRFAIGDPDIQIIDALAGGTLDKVAAGEQLANRGEVLVDETAVSAFNDLFTHEWRVDKNGRYFAVIGRLPPDNITPEKAWPSDLSLSDDITRNWLLPAVCARISGGSGFLAELRPAASLFLKFGGIDFDNDDDAGMKLDAFTRQAQQILRKYDGNLLQMPIGDKGSYFNASFGAPIAHDDDAARAVAAALDLVRLPDELGFITAVQIGISQGLMWTGAVGADVRHTYAMMGDQTNMSARLMGKAAPGQILISQAIVDDTAAICRFHALGAMQMKGSDEPMEVFSVIGRRQRVQEMGRYTLPLVGREPELAQLRTIAERAMSGHGQIVKLSGGAGTGKSHLAAEFAKRAAAQKAYLAVGICQSVSQDTAYTPWTQVFRTILGVAIHDDGLNVDEQIAQLEQTLHHFNPEWELRLPLLGDLLGLPIEDNPTTAAFDPSLRQQALFSLLVEIVQSWAHEQPLLLLIEDIQWMDEASRALTLALARAIGSHAVVMLLLERPSSEKVEIPELDDLAYINILSLDELSREGMAALIEGRLGKKPTTLLVSLIAEKAHGNPFFIEELLETLEELEQIAPRPDGMISISDKTFDALRRASLVKPQGDEWVIVEGADLTAVHLNIPSSIHGTVLSRIDRLPETHKLTLKVASVIGRRFAFNLLHPSHPRHPDTSELQMETAEMAAREFINLTEPMPHLAYLFRHNTTHEVTYETLLYAQRKRLHRVVADALEALQPELIDQLAYHTFIAEEWERAMRYYLQAGEWAKQLFANHQAIEHFNKALHCAEAAQAENLRVNTAVERRTIHLALGELLTSIGQYDTARDHLANALALAEEQADGNAQANACRWFARSYELQGEYPPALEWIDRGLKVEGVGETAVGAELMLIAGLINTRQGKYDLALSLCKRVQCIAKKTDQLPVLARSYNLQGIVIRVRGDSANAIEHFQKGFNLYEQVKDIYGQAISYNEIANAYFYMGQWTKADRYYNLSHNIFHQIGDVYNSAIAENNLGGIALNQGRLDDATTFYQNGLHNLERSGGSLWGLGVFHSNLGAVYLCTNQTELAYQHLNNSRHYFEEANARDFTPELDRRFAELFIMQKDMVQARNHIKSSIDLARELGVRGEEGQSFGVLAMIEIDENKVDRAKLHLKKSDSILSDIGEKYQWARTQIIWARVHIIEKDFVAAIERLESATAVFENLEAKLDLDGIENLKQKIQEMS